MIPSGLNLPETLRVSSWKSWPAKTMKSDCPQSNLIWTPLSATLHVASWLSNSNNSLDGLRDRQAEKGSRCPQLSESCQQAVKCLWPFLVHLLFHNIGIFFMSLPAWCMWFVTEQRSVVLKNQEGKRNCWEAAAEGRRRNTWWECLMKYIAHGMRRSRGTAASVVLSFHLAVICQLSG